MRNNGASSRRSMKEDFNANVSIIIWSFICMDSLIGLSHTKHKVRCHDVEATRESDEESDSSQHHGQRVSGP